MHLTLIIIIRERLRVHLLMFQPFLSSFFWLPINFLPTLFSFHLDEWFGREDLSSLISMEVPPAISRQSWSLTSSLSLSLVTFFPSLSPYFLPSIFCLFYLFLQLDLLHVEPSEFHARSLSLIIVSSQDVLKFTLIDGFVASTRV